MLGDIQTLQTIAADMTTEKIRQVTSRHPPRGAGGHFRSMQSSVLAIANPSVIAIIVSFSETGLQLNTKKCEVIIEDFTQIDNVAAFNDFIKVDIPWGSNY